LLLSWYLSLGDQTPKIAVTTSSLIPLVVSDSCFSLSSSLLHDSLALSRFPRPVNPCSLGQLFVLLLAIFSCHA
jgi:hypothetical protein